MHSLKSKNPRTFVTIYYIGLLYIIGIYYTYITYIILCILCTYIIGTYIYCSTERCGFIGAQKGAPSINWNSTDILSVKDLNFEKFGPLSFMIPVLTNYQLLKVSTSATARVSHPAR